MPSDALYIPSKLSDLSGVLPPAQLPLATKAARCLARAQAFNPQDADPISSGVTMTVSSSHDATLTNQTAFNVANKAKFSYAGGCPTVGSDTFTYMPVACALPMTATNLVTPFAAAGYNAWNWEPSISTEGSTVEFQIFQGNTMSSRVRVDGRYVTSRTPVALSTSPAYVKLDFGGVRKLRTIAIELNQYNIVGFVAVKPTEQISPGHVPEKFVAFVTGDSYTSGIGVAGTGYLAYCRTFGQLAGFSDVRQVGVSGTGYLANNTNQSKTLRNQIADWATVNTDVTPDVIFVASGYNDRATTAALVQAEAVLFYQALRAAYATQPIVILGPWPASTGPSAQVLGIETAVQAAITASAVSNIYFAPVSSDVPPWMTGTGRVGATTGTGTADLNIGADATHPTSDGHDVLARRMLRAWTKTLTQLTV